MATYTITQSVGLLGANKDADVRIIRQALNQAGPCGGPDIPLEVNDPISPHDRKLIDAIRRFQLFHFGISNGRIDAGEATIQALNQVAAGGGACSTPPAALVCKHLRSEIVRIAGYEADRPDKVADMTNRKKRTAQEAARLQTYYKVLPESLDWPITAFEAGKPGGKSWCAIFATWVLSQVFAEEMKFVGGNVAPGIFRGSKKLVTHKDAYYAQGDICLTTEESNKDEPFPTHHFFVAATPARGDGTMPTIEGNYWGHSVKRHRRGAGTYSYYSVFEPEKL